MADHEHTGSDPISGPADRAVDDRLRAAGARLRATAPSAGGVAPPGANGRRRDSRRWYVAAGAMAAAAALGAILIVLPRGDETVRQVPSDTGPTSPTVPTDPDDDADVPPLTAPTTEPTPTTDPADAWSTAATVRQQPSLDDWDGDGGVCVTLILTEPLEPREVPMCVTGRQLDATAEAYIRGAGYGVAWWARSAPDGGIESAIDSIATGPDFDGHAEFAEGTAAPCGAPRHELPADQWYLVSNCADGAALYTPLPAGPTEPADSSVLVGAERSTTPLPATPVPTPDSTGPLTLYEVEVDALDIALDRCVVVAPDGADPWFESCGFSDLPAWNGLMSYGSQVFVLEQVDEIRLVPLDPAAVLRTHGCSTPVLEVLDAMADPNEMLADLPGLMVTGLACDAADSPFDNPPADHFASASYGSVHLRAGPGDGGLIVLERPDDGPWSITDNGTGLELDPWPHPIPPAEWFSTDTDLLPPIDVTETLRSEIGDAETIEALAEAIETYLLGLHEPEAGDPPSVVIAGGLPDQPFGQRLLGAELGYLDDATRSGAYSIWVTPPAADRPASIERAYVTNRCGRGVTEADGALLCV